MNENDRMRSAMPVVRRWRRIKALAGLAVLLGAFGGTFPTVASQMQAFSDIADRQKPVDVDVVVSTATEPWTELFMITDTSIYRDRSQFLNSLGEP